MNLRVLVADDERAAALAVIFAGAWCDAFALLKRSSTAGSRTAGRR